jgi:hypothetical protein
VQHHAAVQRDMGLLEGAPAQDVTLDQQEAISCTMQHSKLANRKWFVNWYLWHP